jgi:hypothetical protein
MGLLLGLAFRITVLVRAISGATPFQLNLLAPDVAPQLRLDVKR